MTRSQRRRRPASRSMYVKPVSVSIAYDGGHSGRGHAIQHTVIVDDEGDVHERFADDPPGAWDTWDRSLLPKRKPRNARRLRRR